MKVLYIHGSIYFKIHGIGEYIFLFHLFVLMEEGATLFPGLLLHTRAEEGKKPYRIFEVRCLPNTYSYNKKL